MFPEEHKAKEPRSSVNRMVENSADSNHPNKRLSNNKFSNLSDAHGADMNMAAEQQPLPVLVMDSDDFPNQGA